VETGDDVSCSFGGFKRRRFSGLRLVWAVVLVTGAVAVRACLCLLNRLLVWQVKRRGLSRKDFVGM